MRSRSIVSVGLAAVLIMALAPAASAAVRRLRVVDATSVTEASTVMRFKVKLSRRAARRVTVAFQTVNGTATAGEDYVAKSGKLTFRRGQSSKTVSVRMLDDRVEEGVETVKLRIKNPRRARIADGVGVGKIVGDADASLGELVINELMPNPSGLETQGEWLEIASLDDGPVDLSGFVLDEVGLCTLSGTIPAGGYFVIGRDLSTQSYADVSCAMTLVNTGELIRIWNTDPASPGAIVWDGVDSATWMPSSDGVSFNLDPDEMSTTANDAGDNWCYATSPFSTEYGTPGAANTQCP